VRERAREGEKEGKTYLITRGVCYTNSTRKREKMTEQEKLRKIEHYKYMLETMELNPRHRYWVEDQLADLEGK
jgi:hypothetical protein